MKERKDQIRKKLKDNGEIMEKRKKRMKKEIEKRREEIRREFEGKKGIIEESKEKMEKDI